jgi:hypothetical protein
MAIDVGAGMRSADIHDGREHAPDEGTCAACRARGRLTKDGTMRKHWRYGWPRRAGHPPCGGSGQEPAVLNERRVTRYLAAKRTDPWDYEDEITATAMVERQVTVTRWEPIEAGEGA